MLNKKCRYKPITFSCVFSETMQKENTHLQQMYEINKNKIKKKNKLFQSNKYTFEDHFLFSLTSFCSLPFLCFFINWKKNSHFNQMNNLLKSF